MFRVGLYARVSTNDQQTLAMQNRAMREYAARRGWTIAMQVREVNSGAGAKREAREKVLEAARRREIDVVLVWRLDRWGRSVTDLLATLQELEHMGVGFGVADLWRSPGSDDSGRASDGCHARSVCRLRTRDSTGTDSGRFGSCAAERQTPWPTRNGGYAYCGNQETAPCGYQQIRDRSPLEDRPHLGSPNFGLTYFPVK